VVLDGGGRPFPRPTAAAGERLDDRVGGRFLVLARGRSDLGAAAGRCRASGACVAAPDEIPDAGGAVAGWLARSGRRIAVVRPDRSVAGTADGLDGITARLRPWLDGGVASG
jgi:hypothetical protein